MFAWIRQEIKVTVWLWHSLWKSKYALRNAESRHNRAKGRVQLIDYGRAWQVRREKGCKVSLPALVFDKDINDFYLGVDLTVLGI